MNTIDFTTNKIIITDNIEQTQEDILNQLSDKMVKLFCKDEFLIEDAKAVTKEAYIKESKEKYIVICAHSFNIYAQNSLLKILEESPSNTIFIIISNSKSNFLPTIRSRLQILNLSKNRKKDALEIDLYKMDLNEIFLFVKKHQRISKNQLKELIQTIFYEAIHIYGIRLSEKEMEVFENALQLADLNTRADFLLSTALLTIFNRDEKQR